MRTPLAQLFSGYLLLAAFTLAQQAGPPPPKQEGAPTANTPKDESTSSGKKKSVPAYVIVGTVFNENALSYPNARVRIRRENEKKYRWETYTNSRGEFAVRVPEGQEYEVEVKEKHYKEVSLKVNANNGDMQQRLSIRLEAANQENSGEKK